MLPAGWLKRYPRDFAAVFGAGGAADQVECLAASRTARRGDDKVAIFTSHDFAVSGAELGVRSCGVVRRGSNLLRLIFSRGGAKGQTGGAHGVAAQ